MGRRHRLLGYAKKVEALLHASLTRPGMKLKLKLIELLKLYGVELPSFKIHLATVSDDGVNPLQVFLAGHFKDGFQAWQAKRNFNSKRILALIDLNQGDGKWLFSGVFEVTGSPTKPGGPQGRYFYPTEEVGGIEDLVGRVIVQFPWKKRARYLHGAPHRDGMLVAHILPATYSVPAFPGYEKVRISHAELKLIVNEVEPSWKSALSSVAGIYLIFDRAEGKHYVGSASGAAGVWQRWCSYAANGHGGNTVLRGLMDKTGPTFCEKFQYSILEVLNRSESETEVELREEHWKLVLGSRSLGHNGN